MASIRRMPATMAAGRVRGQGRIPAGYRNSPLRGKPKSLLRPGLAGQPPFRGILVHLAPSRFGKPKSRLFAPAVAAVPPFRGILVAFAAKIPFRRPVHFLRGPIVVRLAVEIYGPKITTVPGRAGKPKSFLRKPVVVIIPFFQGPETHLAYSLRGKPKSKLRPPARVGAGIAFFGPQITLVRIKPPPTEHFLKPPTVAIQICYGVVFGGDSNPYQEAMSDSGTQVIGGDSAPGLAQGESAAGSIVSGGDEPGGEQTLSDERREGC